jgi:hypothetical protein
MAIVVENTPNPRALKFTLDGPVGGPATFTDAVSADERIAPILELDGVSSVFMTANFVTVTRSDTASWSDLRDRIVTILSESFG